MSSHHAPSSCWLHPGLEVRRSPIAGHGLFAMQPMASSTIVFTLGGDLVTESELRTLLAEATRYVDTISVDEDLHLILREGMSVHFGNHSCEPSAWHLDTYRVALRHDVPAGAEITVDYATQTADPAFSFACSCGAAPCRGTVTGNDWRLPQWQDRYAGHVVPAVAKRVRLTHND